MGPSRDLDSSWPLPPGTGAKVAGRQVVGQLEAAPRISMAGAPYVRDQEFPVPSGDKKQRWLEAAEWAPILLSVKTSQWGDSQTRRDGHQCCLKAALLLQSHWGATFNIEKAKSSHLPLPPPIPP